MATVDPAKWVTDNMPFITMPAERLLALTAYGEAANQGAQGMMAVLNVIANRARDLGTYGYQPIYAMTRSPWHAVALKPFQFSAFNMTDPVRAKLETLAASWDSAVASNAALAQAYQLAQMTTSNLLADNTAGATHYHTTAILPSWAGTITKVGQIGSHIFYSAYPSWDRVRGAIASVKQAITDVFAVEEGEVPWALIALLALGAGGIYYATRRRRR